MDDQDRLLDEATAVVKEQAFYMKRAIDNDNLREALKHASNVTSELRTSLLSPKNYYELYMQVFQELQHLSAFFSDKSRHNRKMIDLYESVQHAGSILPRLYLLATVGSGYIKSKEAPAKEILTDMSELCKGVQHPIRGLFLRYFLSQMVKDKLPDTGSAYEEAGGGDINDAFSFLLSNFEESNRLWARMQHQGPLKDRGARENQRMHLRVLVGSNLVNLSQLDGMTVEFYSRVALPKLLDHILSVKDTISQQYLFECMIQVFPDIFHIQTLEQELCAYTKAQPTVDMKPIMTALMKRLTNFLLSDEAETEEHALKGVDIFTLFRTHLQSILERVLEPGAGGASSTPDLAAPLEVQSEFMQFTLVLYPDKIHYVDLILGSTVDILHKYFQRTGGGKSTVTGSGAEKIVDLLACPVKPFSLQVLTMEHYSTLLAYLDHDTRRKVGLSMIEIVLEQDIPLSTPDELANLFNFSSALLKDQDDQGSSYLNSPDFILEQQQVCRLVHQIRSPDVDIEFQMLSSARSYFGQGGPQRIALTLPPLVYSVLRLAQKIVDLIRRRQELAELETPEEEMPTAPVVTVKKIFQFVHKTITVLVPHAPDVAFQLWMCAAVVSDKFELEDICYEFLTQGLLCYEEDIADSKKQYDAILQLVATLNILNHLDEENYNVLTTKVIQHSQRFLKKPMQCRAIACCSQMFWNRSCQDGSKVLQSLQKCLKICDAVSQNDPNQVGLWVEMLDKYVYFIEKECSTVEIKFVNGLLALCREHIEFAQSMEGETKVHAANATAHLNNSIKYIRLLKTLPEQEQNFAEVDV